MRFETSAGMARFLHNAKTSQGWAQDDAEAGLGDASHWWVMRDPSSGGAEGAGPADVAENHGHAGDDVHEGDHDHAGEHDHAEGEVCALPALSPGFLISSILNGTAWKPAPQAAPEAITFDPTVNLSAMPANGVGVAYGDTFKLHSNPGSQFRVYLDFDGHTTTGTSWNSYWGVSSIVSPAFSTSDGSPNFSATELSAIQQVWQRVAEDFAPFNIDVTTASAS